jgi:hypothetical protein
MDVDRDKFVRYAHCLSEKGLEAFLSDLDPKDQQSALRVEAFLPVAGLFRSDTGNVQYSFPVQEEDEDPPYFFRVVRDHRLWRWYVLRTEGCKTLASGEEASGFAALVRAHLAYMDAGLPPESLALRRQWDRYKLGVDAPPACSSCGAPVERDRYIFVSPACHKCLPPVLRRTLQ